MQTTLCNNPGYHRSSEVWDDKGLLLNTLPLNLAPRPFYPPNFMVSITFIVVTRTQDLGIMIPDVAEYLLLTPTI